jgi:Holliday junction resolvase
MAAQRESAVEAALVRYARVHGIYTRKFSSPARRGVPDRIFIHRGKVLFLEVKRPGQGPTKLQKHEIAEIRLAGGNADWCDSVERGMEALQLYLNELL